MTIEVLQQVAELLEIKYDKRTGEEKMSALLADHIGGMSDEDREKLVADLAELELKYELPEKKEDGDSGDKTDEDAPETPKGGMSLLNNGKRKHSINGVLLSPGEGITLTEDQLEDERLMAKVKTSIRCGILVEVE